MSAPPSPKNTLLVPVDFSDASRAALALAEELAKPLGATITLLHVIVEPVVAYPGMSPMFVPGLGPELAVAARRELDHLAAEHPGADVVVRTGDPAGEVLAVAASTKPAMVVMGTHGRRGFERFVLGSVAERVVRACEVPVLTVRHPDAS